jgi:RNA polymerase sigma factor (sigma-70 family)
VTQPGPADTVDAVWKLESATIVAGLMRMVHDVGLAEELAQDAFVAALEQWPATGVPDNPGAWLMTAAKRRAVDHLRRSQRLRLRHAQLAHERGDAAEPEPRRDDVLRLMFISCHPVLPTEARLALTLRVVGGLTAAEIARAFLTSEPEIARRIATAKRALADAGVAFELPAPDELAGRLSSVLEVVYLIFNEGYAATAGADLTRPELTHEALRLGRMLAELAPGEAEVHGLVALMELQASRSAARTGPAGEPLRLHEQDRGRWDPLLIRRGFTAMLRAREIGGTPGPYVLQAAIAVCHAQARSAADTDWTRIAVLYDALVRLLPTPIVRLNRAVARGMAFGPEAGLADVDGLLADPRLKDYHLLPSVRGDLLARLGRTAEARIEFERAAGMSGNAAESAFLLRRAAELPPAELPAPSRVASSAAPSAASLAAPSVASLAASPAASPAGDSAAEAGRAPGAGSGAGRTLGAAADAFLDGLDAATLRSYRQTLHRLRRTLGDRIPLAAVTADDVARAFATAWSGASAATWNRHLSAARSFAARSGAAHLTAGLNRRTADRTPTPALTAARVDALCARADLPLRDRVLWRLLHESGAGVTAALALNVEDLDLDDRRARIRGGWLTWRSGTARLLPDLIGGRTRGPLFLTGRRPGPARTPDPKDLCPDTGRRRLSYERAEYLFKRASDGHTLRQLRDRG